jgi:hypothetical protein
MAQPAAQKANKEVSKEGEATKKSKKAETFPVGPVDEFYRGTPRSSAKGFFKAASHPASSPSTLTSKTIPCDITPFQTDAGVWAGF